MAKYISQRAIQRQRKRFLKRIVLFVVLICFFLFLSSWLSKLEKFNIQNINISGNSVVREKEVLKIVNKNILGKYFWLFSKSHFLIYPKAEIKKELLDSFTQIKELTIKFGDFQSIAVNLVERKPYALWCQGLVVEQCYFMDEGAYIYEKAPHFSNDVYFKYFGGFLNVSTSTPATKILRRTYLEQAGERQFGKVNLFIRLLKDININGHKLIVKENNDYELFFNNDSKLIFDGSQNLDEIFENLQAVLIELNDLQGKDFEYIDLRFGNKVLYKFREI